MRLYRICHVRYLQDLRGLGASYRDGARWNEPGFPVVYFAETPSVAMLEMAHYLPSPRLVPPGYRLGVYEVKPREARGRGEDNLAHQASRAPGPRARAAAHLRRRRFGPAPGTGCVYPRHPCRRRPGGSGSP
ncbi:MAG: RES family NAD+ phosphorylase [Gammaproteobacteria bacterium]|nr:RES family NAD+ phosphorylase [Gammaproteobacteria bacterium]